MTPHRTTVDWRNAGVIVALTLAYLTVALAPIVLAWRAELPRRPFLDEMSSGLAMAAFAVLLLEFVVSGRYRAISRALGLDAAMRYHQLLAYAAVAFVILHPFLYTLPIAHRPWDYERLTSVTLTPAGTVTGLIAWALLVCLVGLAAFRDQLPWRYELWRATHGAGAALIAITAAHHTLDVGRYSAQPALANFWLVATAVALGSLAYLYIVRPLLRALRPYRISHVSRAGERTWLLAIEPATRRHIRFSAGQAAWIKVGRGRNPLADNPFSISSSPAAAPRLEFLVKELGDFSKSVGTLAPGTPVYVDGPYGNFTLAGRKGAGIAFVAGGIGVAPILSMLRTLAAARDACPIVLVYGNRTEAQILAREELDDMRRVLDLRVEYLLSEPPAGWQGHIGTLDRDMLDAALPKNDRASWLYFVCGPPPMIDSVETALAGFGVPLGQVVSERFRYDSSQFTPRERRMFTALAGIAATLLIAIGAFALR